MIEVKNVNFCYTNNADDELSEYTEEETQKTEIDEKEAVLKDINFSVKKGECVLLCGKSGCGKTSITKLINGLIPGFVQGDMTGKVFINGKDTENLHVYEIAESVSSVFQNPKSQFFNVDAESEITFGMENQAKSLEEINSRLEKTIKEFKLENILQKNVFKMSGGEKQLIAFAGAYASNPEVFVLDEPAANLDVQTIENIRNILLKMKEEGKTIVIAEHRLSYLKDLVDTVLYIEDGKIAETYTAKEFYAMDEQKRISKGLRKLVWDNSIKLQKKDDSVIAEKNEMKIENLKVAFKNDVLLENVNLTFTSGEIIGITGRNGRGKTSFARFICGLEKIKSGKVFWNGKELSSKERQKMTYMVMQDVNHQLFGESVKDECFLGNDISDEKIVDEILKQTDLIDFAECHPQSLSGGQKQRLAIAVSMVADKKFMIFDEPTSGLDYEHMVQISEIIKKLSEKGVIILIITHDMEFLNSTCNRCLILEDKQLKEITE